MFQRGCKKPIKNRTKNKKFFKKVFTNLKKYAMIGYLKKEIYDMVKSEMICNLPSANGIKAAAATVPGMVITGENMSSKKGSFEPSRGIELGR